MSKRVLLRRGRFFSPPCGVWAVQRSQAGQALTEFLVASLVLIPMLLMIPLLGKLSDVNHTAIAASRYAAWERTVSTPKAKSDAALQKEIQRRFFEAPGIKLKTKETDRSVSTTNALWSVDADTRLVESSARSVSMKLQPESDGGFAQAGALAALSKISSALKGKGGDAMASLETKGMTTARVSVDIASNTLAFDRGHGCSATAAESFACLSRQTAILTDTWDAGEQEQVIARTQGFVPASLFKPAEKLLKALADIKLVPEARGFKPGYIAPDAVPGDRLGRYAE